MTGRSVPRSASRAGLARPVLQMKGIAKTFGSTRVLKDVNLVAYPGEIHVLMGENGAGKSTLMKILSGVHQADPGGEIRIGGEPAQIGAPSDARRYGVVTIYQELALAPNLSVAENVFLGHEKSVRGLVDRGAMEAACLPVLERLAAPFHPHTLVSALSIAEQQMVEIARALMADARILIMDEPTTSLSSRETDRLFALVRQFRAEGMAIIYISHRMAEIEELADRVTVLRDGIAVGTLPKSECDHATLVRMMVGRDLSSFYKKEHSVPDAARAVVLRVQNVGDGRRVHDCSFDVHAGEVLGIAGLVGAGRTELARLVCGIDRRTGGSIHLDGQEVPARSPAEVIERGIVYLTEDRKGLGLYLDMTVRESINIDVLDRDARLGGVLDLAAGRRRAADAIRRLPVRSAGGDTVNVGALSGGNQQKVLLARLLETKPRVIVLDEPTRGVDIGAKSEIYRLIDTLARSGMGIVVVSSELPEIIGVCDRVLVMRDGRLAGELHSRPGAPVTQEAIMAVVTSGARAAAE